MVEFEIQNIPSKMIRDQNYELSWHFGLGVIWNNVTDIHKKN